jgi:hypothetical protein
MPIVEETPDWKPCSNARCWFDLIVLGGLYSAGIFMAFEMTTSWLFSGNPLLPLQFFAVPFLGTEAVTVGSHGIDVAVAGLPIPIAVSILSAYFLAAVLSYFPKLAAGFESLITSACVLGYLLWILDFAAIAHLALPRSITIDIHPGLHGFIGHVFAYGMVLGLHVHRRQEKRRLGVVHVRFRF